MGLNIKNEETHRLAAQLANLTGESMTAAVTAALRERLERVQRSRDVEETLERARLLIAQAGGPESYQAVDDLFDDQGLPA